MAFYKINIQGIVQGVGFRPFLFNLADFFGLTGSIINRGNIGVELIVQSKKKETIDEFIEAILSKKPSIAFIESITFHKLSDLESRTSDQKEIIKTLRILPSEEGVGPSVTSPPDIDYLFRLH